MATAPRLATAVARGVFRFPPLGGGAGHADGYSLRMKHIAVFAFMVALGVLALAAQPGGDPMEANAALAFAGNGAVFTPSCQTTACQTGWQVAQERAISDAEECRLVSSNQEEVGGCRAYVQAALQDRLERGW